MPRVRLARTGGAVRAPVRMPKYSLLAAARTTACALPSDIFSRLTNLSRRARGSHTGGYEPIWIRRRDRGRVPLAGGEGFARHARHRASDPAHHRAGGHSRGAVQTWAGRCRGPIRAFAIARLAEAAGGASSALAINAAAAMMSAALLWGIFMGITGLGVDRRAVARPPIHAGAWHYGGDLRPWASVGPDIHPDGP